MNLAAPASAHVSQALDGSTQAGAGLFLRPASTSGVPELPGRAVPQSLRIERSNLLHIEPVTAPMQFLRFPDALDVLPFEEEHAVKAHVIKQLQSPQMVPVYSYACG